MPTRLQIRQRVQDNLEDTGVTFFTEETINDTIQKGYTRYSIITGGITFSKYFPNLNQPYWYLRQFLPNLLYLKGIYYFTVDRWLEATRLKYIRAIDDKWETRTGTPQYFIPIDFFRMGIYPHSNVASGEHLIYYSGLAPTLIDSSTPKIPQVASTLLENYTTSKLLLELKEFNKATEYWNSYKADLQVAKLHLQTAQAKADKMNVLQPYIQMPMYVRGSSSGMFVDNETITGTIDGANDTFTLAGSPNPADSLCLYKNGQLLFEGEGYILSGNTIVFAAGYIPNGDDECRAWYRM